MKELLYLLTGLFVALLNGCQPSGGGMAYRDTILATRPSAMIAYYELNGNLDDSSPNGLTGASGTAITYSLNGIGGSQTAVFNGSSSYIDLGSNFRTEIDALDFDSLTVLLWVAVRNDSIWPTAALKTAFSMINGESDFLDVYKPLAGRQLAAAMADGTHVVGGGILNPAGNDFYMVALTLDAVAGVGRVYINGAFNSEVAYAGGAWGSALTSSEVGRRGAGNYWDGRIDELTVWGEALSADEIRAIYNAGIYDPVGPSVGTSAILQIFDRTGVPIGEVLPEIDYVSWRRNEIGQAVFYLAKTDPKVNDTFLRAQNRVLVSFDNGLPPWGGIMQPEFMIDHSRIRVRALTAESLLSKRLTDRGRYFNQQTVGNIASALINEANAVLPLGIELGTVWAGGTRHSPEYHYKDLLTIFRDSLFKRLSDADFYTEPVIQSAGRLIFRLNVVERRGQDVPGVALHQGLNVVEPTRLGYSGPIINRWVIVGDGDGWGSDRPVAVAEDLDSIARYGRLEASEVHQGVIYQETLQETADNLLAETALPRIILDVTAVDQPPATFEQYDIGDNLPVELPDYGIGSSFVGAATVMARAFYPRDGRLNLVLEATAAA
jgi:hypothetical protein